MHTEKKRVIMFIAIVYTLTFLCGLPLFFITNLNKMEKDKAIHLVDKLRDSITAAADANDAYAVNYAEIPLVGRTIFEQQRLLYHSLLEWLDTFESQFKADS